MLFTLLSSLLALTTTQAEAGGGGCDGECPPPDPKEKIVECRLLEFRAVDESTFELDPSVKPLFEKLKNFSLLYTGDSKQLYNLQLMDRTGKISHWHHYSDPDAIDLVNFSFNARDYYQQRWSTSHDTPRPLVESYVIQVVQEPNSPFARMRLRAYGLFDPQTPWKSSWATVFEAALQCRPFKG